MSQLDLFRLDGRVALVPGGGGAIGGGHRGRPRRAPARKVAVADVTIDRAEATAEKVRAAGGEALALAVDATQEAECDRIVAETVDAVRARSTSS